MTRILIIGMMVLFSVVPPVLAQSNLLLTVQRIRLDYPTPMSPAQRAELLNRVAWEHRSEGWGLLQKTGGNRCPAPQGVDIACDILVYAPTPWHYDVLIDSEGAATPAWIDAGPCDPNVSGCAMDRFLLPTAPPGLQTPPPDQQIVVFNDNGDAYKDLLRYNRTDGTWMIEHGNAMGQFDVARTGGWATGWQIVRADFNADGLDDLFLYNPVTGVWFKAINMGGAFSYFTQGWQPGLNVYIAELNGDGRSDVFLYNPTTGLWFTCISIGNGTAGFTYTTGGWRTGFVILQSDFDGDNRTDFLLHDPAVGTFFKAITRGNGVFAYSTGEWAPGWVPLVVELNGDAHDDVFLYNPTTGEWFRATSVGDGTAGFSYVSGGWTPGWTVQIADFDANGSTDLFLYNASGTWYKVINTGSAFTYSTGGWALWSTTVVDLNGDAKSDVFLVNPSTGKWYQALTTTPGEFMYTTGSFPR